MMYRTIPVQYLDRFLEQGFEGVVVDVRNREAYESGHIDGAVNIPYEKLLENPSVLPGDKRLLFYCSRGSESLLVCIRLSRMGYRTINVANGMNFYRGEYLVKGPELTDSEEKGD